MAIEIIRGSIMNINITYKFTMPQDKSFYDYCFCEYYPTIRLRFIYNNKKFNKIYNLAHREWLLCINEDVSPVEIYLRSYDENICAIADIIKRYGMERILQKLVISIINKYNEENEKLTTLEKSKEYLLGLRTHGWNSINLEIPDTELNTTKEDTKNV